MDNEKSKEENTTYKITLKIGNFDIINSDYSELSNDQLLYLIKQLINKNIINKELDNDNKTIKLSIDYTQLTKEQKSELNQVLTNGKFIYAHNAEGINSIIENIDLYHIIDLSNEELFGQDFISFIKALKYNNTVHTLLLKDNDNINFNYAKMLCKALSNNNDGKKCFIELRNEKLLFTSERLKEISEECPNIFAIRLNLQDELMKKNNLYNSIKFEEKFSQKNDLQHLFNTEFLTESNIRDIYVFDGDLSDLN